MSTDISIDTLSPVCFVVVVSVVVVFSPECLFGAWHSAEHKWGLLK